MTTEMKTVLDLMLLNYKLEKKTDKNEDYINGYLACVVDIVDCIAFNHIPEMQKYRDLLTKEILNK